MRISLCSFFFSIFVFFCCSRGNTQVIYTVAGGNVPTDNIPSASAQISSPYSVAVDANNNIYIADAGHNLIRKVNPAGIIVTVAGTGVRGFSGDGGKATAAQISFPRGIAVDPAGNLYIAGDQRIRKINSAGIISTIAGNGTAGFSGDGGSAIVAQFNNPYGIAADGNGNIYIADHDNNRIRKINSSGTITTIAGTGAMAFSGDGGAATSARLFYPSGVAIDWAGNIYICDQANARIRKISGGIINTVAGGGTGGDGGLATLAQLGNPFNVNVDKSGNIYIPDAQKQNIRKVNSAGVISTIAGIGIQGFSGDNGLARAAEFNNPVCVAIDSSGNLLVGDLLNGRIRKIDFSGIITTYAGIGNDNFSGDGGTAVLAQLDNPHGITFDTQGNLYIADAANYRIRKINTAGIINTVVGSGNPGFGGDGGQATSAKMSVSNMVAIDKIGNLYIAETYGTRIRKVDTAGIINTIAGTGISGYSGDGGLATSAQLNTALSVAVDGTGNVFIADFNNYRVRKIDTNGMITTIAGNGTNGFSGDGGPAPAAQISNPISIALDQSSNLYIAELERIRKVDVNGTITTIAGIGTYGFSGDGGPAILAQFSNIDQITVDANGNIYVCDASNERVRKIDNTGVITTIAGNGVAAYGGDGGLSTKAQLYEPGGVAVDVAGNVFISDTYDFHIRKVCITAQPAATKTADSSNTTTVFDINNTIALHNGCDAIANLTPNGSSPVLGPVNSQVWVDNVQSPGYVERHYQITPSVSPTTSTATVTLFYPQTDFDNFNAVNSVKLPQNPTDAAGKANFKIEKRSGVSFDATGSPSTYNGSVVIIDPADSNIVWNNALSRWEISFDVTGFSGFFAKTSAAVLPVQWLSVNGKLNNSGFAEIDWRVEEQNVANYNVQKSEDGSNFQTIGTLASIGNGQHSYRFAENQLLNGKAIYRVKQTDKDGRIDYSQVVYLGSAGKTVVYPNPATSTTTLFSSAGLLNSKALLYNLQGKLLQQINIRQNVQAIDLSSIAAGVFLLKLANGQTVKLIKE